MTVYIIIGSILLLFILIGQIRLGVEADFIDNRFSLSVRVAGIRKQLVPRIKKNSGSPGEGSPDEKDKENQSGKESLKDRLLKKIKAMLKGKLNRSGENGEQKENGKGRERKEKEQKKKKKFYKFDGTDVMEMLSAVRKGLRKFGRGFHCERLLIHFTAAFSDPYSTAKLSACVNACLSALYPVLDKGNGTKDIDIRTGIDFDKKIPDLDFGTTVTFRVGALAEAAFCMLFRFLWIYLKVICRFLWMRITDPEEYDFRMNRQENLFGFIRRIVREIRELRESRKTDETEQAGQTEQNGQAELNGQEELNGESEPEKENSGSNSTDENCAHNVQSEGTRCTGGTESTENADSRTDTERPYYSDYTENTNFRGNINMENTKNNPISELLSSTMENVKNILHTDTVVGDPITTPDGITLIPVSRVNVGFGGGGIEFGAARKDGTQPYGGGNATGVRVDPIGFLVVKNGVVRMVNVTPPGFTTVDRILDLVPQVLDRIEEIYNKNTEDYSL